MSRRVIPITSARTTGPVVSWNGLSTARELRERPKLPNRLAAADVKEGDTGKAPNTKLQAPEKLQTPSSKCAWSSPIVVSETPLTVDPPALRFEVWRFSGAWSLELGVWSFLALMVGGFLRAMSGHDNMHFGRISIP